jgi:Arm DNA-binding domain
MKLDNRTIANLALPEGKSDVIYFADDLPGFGLRLRQSGPDRVARTWIAQYRARGKTRRMRIGTVERVPADEARKAARTILARVELGGDPAADKTAMRLSQSRTLRAIAEGFLEYQATRLRPESLRISRLYLLSPAYFGPLHSVGAAEITLAHVASRLSAISRTNGTVTAGRCRSALSNNVPLGDG